LPIKGFRLVTASLIHGKLDSNVLRGRGLSPASLAYDSSNDGNDHHTACNKQSLLFALMYNNKIPVFSSWGVQQLFEKLTLYLHFPL